MEIKAFLRKNVWEEKLLNPFGMALLTLCAVGIGTLVATYGALGAILLIGGLLALPVVYSVVAYPKFGIIVLLILAYFLFFILRLGINFPIGTLMDGLEWLLILGTILTYRNSRQRGIFRNPVALLVTLWVGYTLFEVLNPVAASRMAWLYTVRTVGAVTLLYFVFLYQIDTVRYLRIVIRFWVVLSVIGAVYAWKQEFIGFSDAELADLADPERAALLFINGHWRKFSVFSDPVTFSYNMVMLFFVSLGIISASKKIGTTILYIVIGIVCTMAMIFSGTRGAYVLIPAGLILYFTLRFSRKVLVIAGVSAVAMGILIFIPTGNPSLYRFQSAFKPSDDASFNVRAQNQKKIQPYILTHPMGGGLGATGVWGARFAPDSFLASFPPDSGYVRVAVEMGWIGLLIFACMIFIVLRTGINNYYLIQDPELKSYCLAMTLVVFVLGVGSYPQEAVVQFPSSILFYLAIAITQCTLRLDMELAAEESILPENNFVTSVSS